MDVQLSDPNSGCLELCKSSQMSRRLLRYPVGEDFLNPGRVMARQVSAYSSGPRLRRPGRTYDARLCRSFQNSGGQPKTRHARMGVRLYDQNLGRFLSVDPIEGGSANDYDYAYQDPINNYDLDGRICWKCIGRRVGRGLKRAAKFVVKNQSWFLLAASFVPGGMAIQAAISAYSVYKIWRGRETSGRKQPELFSLVWASELAHTE